MSPRSTTLPLYFWYWGSNSRFLRWQRSINDAKWTFLPLVLVSSITSFLFLTFVSCHAGMFSNFSHSFSTAAIASGIKNAWGIGMTLCARQQWVTEFIPFAVMWSGWGLCPAPSSLGLVHSSASTTQAYFVLRFPILRWISPLLFIGILQGTSGFLCELEFFVVWLNEEFSSGVFEFWFLDTPSLFCCCIGHKFPHIRPYIIRTRGCLFPRNVPPWTMKYPSGGLSCNKINLVNPVHASDNSFSPSMFSNLQSVFPTLRPVTYVLLW